MITGFEEYTHELTDREIEIAHDLAPILLRMVGKARARTAQKMADHYDTTRPRIRKILHALRVTDAVPLLVASSKGYYIAETTEEVEIYGGSLAERERSIHEVRIALGRQLQQKAEGTTGSLNLG